MSGRRCYVGFGVGPIQLGLFLQSVLRDQRHHRVTLVELDPVLAAGIAGGATVNIAHADGLEAIRLAGFDVLCAGDPGQLLACQAAVNGAHDIVTALPSVRAYSDGPAPVAPVLVRAPVPVDARLYTAENHPHAAGAMRTALRGAGQQGLAPRIIDTVIGKMCGTRPAKRSGPQPLYPGCPLAVVVEVATATVTGPSGLPASQRGLPFPEKSDLAAFNEVKLFGHNALHALLGFQAKLRGLRSMAQLAAAPALVERGRRAVQDEIVPMLRRRHQGHPDDFFQAERLLAHGEALLLRMQNPYLDDPVERVCRDPGRKLGAQDRLVGCMRACLAAGIEPRQVARGAAAAALCVTRQAGGQLAARTVLEEMWRVQSDLPEDPPGWREEVGRLVDEEERSLRGEIHA